MLISHDNRFAVILIITCLLLGAPADAAALEQVEPIANVAAELINPMDSAHQESMLLPSEADGGQATMLGVSQAASPPQLDLLSDHLAAGRCGCNNYAARCRQVKCRCSQCQCSQCQGCASVCDRLSAKWHGQMKPNLQARHWGYPEYFCERPFGACNSSAFGMMLENGLRDQMVLYDYDFGHAGDASQLKPRGAFQLREILQRIPFAGTPVTVQATDNPELDARRQAHVVAALARFGMPLGPEMVVVGRPRVRGLDGPEAVRTYPNLLEQTRLRGNVGIETSGLRDIGFGSSAIGAAAAPATTPQQ